MFAMFLGSLLLFSLEGNKYIDFEEFIVMEDATEEATVDIVDRASFLFFMKFSVGSLSCASFCDFHTLLHLTMLLGL